MLRRKVLVCDDTVGAGKSFAKGLSNEGAYVRVCANEPERIKRRLAAYAPEAALLFAGYERKKLFGFMEELRREFPDLKLFVVSFTNSLSAAKELFQAGADLCFFAPYSPEVAAGVMSAYLDRRPEGLKAAAIACFLSSIGYRRTFAGFGYLSCAISLCLSRPSSLAALYDEVYAKIAEKYGCRVEAVERVLRRDAKLYAKIWAPEAASIEGAKFTAHDMIASLCDMYCSSRYFYLESLQKNESASARK